MGTLQATSLQVVPDTDAVLKDALTRFPTLQLALIFGSVALGRQHADSDLDIAVAARQALTASEKMDIIAALADSTGRPIDLIDLKVVVEPLLGQIVRPPPAGERQSLRPAHHEALV